MRTTLFILQLLCLGIVTSNAQISEKQLQPFIPKGYTLADTSGNGLKKPSGDILLELISNEFNDFETLILLHNEKGKLTQIAENSGLMMSKELYGVSGGNYPSLSGTVLSIDYSIGSSSSLSDISIRFEKTKDGSYLFKQYTSITKNHGVEDLKARQKITAAQTGKINFSDATEELILKKAGIHSVENNEIFFDKDQPQFGKYIPDDFQLAAFAEGDLNADEWKKDAVLLSFNKNQCNIQLLLQQKNGTYNTAQTNTKLMDVDATFNPNNLKLVVKNGYFTIEQKVPVGDNHFDQRYITFKYDVAQKNWFLHRFDVEHYSGFDTKPSKDVTHLTTKEFGKISFTEIQNLPGVYQFEPQTSVISGTLIKKMFYDRPNYGKTPEKDEKVWVYILKTDYPFNVYGDADPQDPETADKTVVNITEIQVYSSDKKIDFDAWENKKIKLQGVFQSARTGNQFTKVIFEVKKNLK
ncbi:hypothetical protein [Soonwooa purpurea]